MKDTSLCLQKGSANAGQKSPSLEGEGKEQLMNKGYWCVTVFLKPPGGAQASFGGVSYSASGGREAPCFALNGLEDGLESRNDCKCRRIRACALL